MTQKFETFLNFQVIFAIISTLTLLALTPIGVFTEPTTEDPYYINGVFHLPYCFDEAHVDFLACRTHYIGYDFKKKRDAPIVEVCL